MNQTVLSVILLATVAFVMACWWLFWRKPNRRPMAERLVDKMYKAAQVMYSAAVAADHALKTYRETRKEVEKAHAPVYAGKAVAA